MALFVRNSIKYARVEIPKEFNNVEILCADIKLGDQSVRMIGYYRSGGFDKEATDYMTASVKCLKNCVLLLIEYCYSAILTFQKLTGIIIEVLITSFITRLYILLIATVLLNV